VKQDVDVKENLDVVAEKADGLQDDGLDTIGGNRFQGLFNGGSDPGTTAGALALEGEPPAGNFRQVGGDQSSGALGFLGVGIGSLAGGPQAGLALTDDGRLDGAAGDAVSCEQNRNGRANGIAEPCRRV